MRSKGGFDRSGEYETGASRGMPTWMEQFAANEAKKESRTAVDVARNRSSADYNIYQQMNAILNGNSSKYSSVEDKVRAYQEQTGLLEHLKRMSEDKEKRLETIANKIKAAAEDEKEPEGEAVVLLARIPEVEAFVNNVIDTNYGIQLPAIQHMILDTFRRDGVKEEDVDDVSFCKWVNSVMIDKKRPESHDYGNLGRGVGVRQEYGGYGRDGNRDPFSSLMPNRSIY